MNPVGLTDAVTFLAGIKLSEMFTARDVGIRVIAGS